MKWTKRGQKKKNIFISVHMCTQNEKLLGFQITLNEPGEAKKTKQNKSHLRVQRGILSTSSLRRQRTWKHKLKWNIYRVNEQIKKF